MNSDALVQLNNIVFSYGKRPVLSNVSLVIEKGDFLGIVGPNGSGKSTLIKLLLNLLEPVEGQVSLFGQSSSKFNQWDRIGYVSQKANSFSSGFPATVYEVVSMGLYGKVGLFRFLRKRHKEMIFRAVEQVGMTDYLYENIGELSGGQQQRVFIARALVSNPELLILDEPTVGVDAKSVESFYGLLHDLNTNHGKTLLLISHDIGAMTDHVNKVACLNKTIHFHGYSSEFAEKKDKLDFYGHDVHLLTHSHEGVAHD
ncbi:zinc transport system ATP-binding protein [Alkalihalobacillus xiaoxiensis]|uniref:Zinc transport system ATP-binding protein n=1 Tax=Shouchella xiaoxiensis TaxID=766895 RepID=A0ABS2SV41_9BACI|nr:zinc transport system ATP-binding protein [Shouchella xiaoxiensis]